MPVSALRVLIRSEIFPIPACVVGSLRSARISAVDDLAATHTPQTAFVVQSCSGAACAIPAFTRLGGYPANNEEYNDANHDVFHTVTPWDTLHSDLSEIII